MNHSFLPLLARALLFGVAAVAQAVAATGSNPLAYEDDDVFMRIYLRTPDQLSAFYQARGFSRGAIDKILDTCFLTPIIKNKSLSVLWLELDNWRFTAGKQPVPRIKREYWPEKWQDIGLPRAHRSTFGWTLMPEVRDLRLDESVGGSVVVPLRSQPLTLRAHFRTGANKQGKPRVIVFEGIQCTSKEK